MQTVKCPPPEQLQAYLSGRLAPDACQMLELHLETCQPCEQTAVRLESDPDTLVELLQSERALPSAYVSSASSISDASLISGEPSGQPRYGVIPTRLGQYELLSRLGTGGMGAVFLARHQSLDKQVAVKLLPALPAQNVEFVQRFQREMRAAGRLDHPSIVRTTDAGQQDGIHFLVMEAIDGMDLARISRAEGKLTVADACEIIRQACLGLDHAHAAGIVHRDIKPSNLILDTVGKVRILDFGLAQIGHWESGREEITTVGQLMGTLDYMAPEQAERGGAVDYRADIYSMAASLFRLLTGRAPLAAAPNLTPFEKLRLLASYKPPKLRSLRADVPEELGKVVDGMLSREPANRPASAIYVAELLEPFSTGADLAGLLQRARSKPVESLHDDNPRTPELWLPLPAIESASQVGNASSANASPTATKSKQSNSGFGWGTWGTVAASLAILFAGVAFVLETSKGQLVIESEADVQVKILSVDSAGQRTEVDELEIEPGAKATKLRSGKYEITLDSASDSFGVTNGSFTIRNGQTVVAKITPKSRESATGTSASGTVTLEDKRLDTIVYAGQTLDTWLRRLKYERDPAQITQALDALLALADQSVRDLIEPEMLDFANDQNNAPNHYEIISEILRNSCGEDYFASLASLLSKLPDDRSREQFLRHSIHSMASARPGDVDSIRPFLDACDQLMMSPEPPIPLSVAEVLRYLSSDLGDTTSFAKDVQQEMVRRIGQSPRVPDDTFWLASPSKFKFKAADGGKFWVVEGSDVFNQELKRRALQVISSSDISEQLFTQAIAVLNSLHYVGISLDDSEKMKIRDSIANVLSTSAKNREAMLFAFSGESTFNLQRHAGAVTPFGSFEYNGSKGYGLYGLNRLILCLNLLQQFEMAQLVQQEIAALYDALCELPLYLDRSDRFLEYVHSPDIETWPSFLQMNGTNGAEMMLLRTVFLQAGFLLDKPQEEIFARVREKQQPDLKNEIDGYLAQLLQGSSAPLQQLGQLGDAIQSENVTRALEQYCLSEAGTFGCFISAPANQLIAVSSYTELWLQAAGERFFESYARVLNAANEEKRLALLRIPFAVYKGVSCNTPGQLKELFVWTDSILGDTSRSPDDELSIATLGMLTMLLMNHSGIADECQQAIIERLASYSSLDVQNFWLASSPSKTFKYWYKVERQGFQAYDGKSVYCLPMRQAIVDRAMKVLTSDAPQNDSLVSQALAVILADIELAGNETQFNDGVKRQLLEFCRQRLSVAAHDVKQSAQFVSIPASLFEICIPRFAADSPELKSDRVSPGRSADPVANLTILTLNIIDALGFAESVASELESLHNAIAELNISSANFYSSRLPNRHASSPEGTIQAIQHTWFIQTGALLNKDIEEILSRPRRLRDAELKNKKRFINPGDTLAIHIPQVLPASGDPPVIQADKDTPVVGFPVIVGEDGKVQLPLIEPLLVAGRELAAVEQLIKEAYVAAAILRDDKLFVTVRFLLRTGESKELRNIGGAQIPAATK